jgi:exodeoxyribonuclease VII small subunit
MTKVDYTNFDYAAKTAELESVLAELQSSDTTLDTAIKLHDAGIKLVAELEAYLKNAELTIRHRTAEE